MLWVLKKKHLNETVLLITQNMFRLLGKKIIAILRSKFCLSSILLNVILSPFCLFISMKICNIVVDIIMMLLDPAERVM